MSLVARRFLCCLVGVTANLAGKSVGFKPLAKGRVTDGQKRLGYVDLGKGCRGPLFFLPSTGFPGFFC